MLTLVTYSVTAEVSPGAGSKFAASRKQDGAYIQHVMFVDADGNPITEENPVPTYPAETPGEEITDSKYSSVVSGAPDNHDYTVPADKVFKFDGILGSSSALIMVQIQYALDGSTFVSLGNRYNDRPPGVDMTLKRAISIPAGGKIRLIRSNRQNPGASISTTILGVLIDA